MRARVPDYHPITPFQTVSLGTSVNKAPVNAPYSSGWHHDWCRSIGETQVGKEEKAAVSSAEENKGLVRRFFEGAFKRGNLDVADELLAPDFAWKLPGKDAGIVAYYKRWVAKQPASSSDLHFSIEEQIAGGVKVITRLIDSGSHDQEEYPGGGGCSEEATRIAHKGYSKLGALGGGLAHERRA
jgi:SnoaL-like domain